MKKKKPVSSINTIIGEDTHITGNIQLHGNIMVYGKIEGDISTKGTINIAQGSHINGQLTGGMIQIGGQVEGNVFAREKVILEDQSYLIGDVKASQIVIEDGAKFEGKCDMHTATEKSPEHTADKSAEKAQ